MVGEASRARGRRQGWGGRAEAARSVPPPGPVGSGGVVNSVGHFPPPRLSNGPLEGCVVLGDRRGWGPPPPASEVEHLTGYKTRREAPGHSQTPRGEWARSSGTFSC